MQGVLMNQTMEGVFSSSLVEHLLWTVEILAVRVYIGSSEIEKGRDAAIGPRRQKSETDRDMIMINVFFHWGRLENGERNMAFNSIFHCRLLLLLSHWIMTQIN